MTENIAGLVARTHERLGGIEIEQFGGDNFAVWLCSQLEDADDEGEEDDCGWKPSAIAGYEAVMAAIRTHYDPALLTLSKQVEEMREASCEVAACLQLLIEALPDEEGEGCFGKLIERSDLALGRLRATLSQSEARNG